MKKTPIIEPINPNKATNLFGGKSSGILNWNDLKHSKLYNYRKLIRNAFYSASDSSLKQIRKIPSVAELETLILLKMLQESINDISELESYATDPSVVSIFSTMIDHSYEHINSVYRLVDTSFKPVKLKETITIKEINDIPNAIESIISQKQSILSNVSHINSLITEDIIKGVSNLLSIIKSNTEEHIEFLEALLEIIKEEI